MCSLVNQLHKSSRTLTFYSHLLDHCRLSKSGNLTKVVHGQLIKVGFNRHTYLGNRCLELYTWGQNIDDFLKAFGDIARKNNVSWNICLKGLLNCGHSEMALSLFRRMPERDVVSWNSMISWYASCGCSEFVWDRFREMLSMGVNPSGHTYSIVLSLVSDGLLGKELHGRMIRSDVIRLNVVLGNSLINMYRKVGLIDYAIFVFWTMEFVDLISWNSLIMGCCKAGYGDLALNQFSSMRSLGYRPDEFTCSAVITSCTNLRNLEKGKQIFAFCIKVGFLYNTIISSAIIYLYSKCNRLEHSVQLFKELDIFDSAVYNAMISSYTSHGIGENAIELLVLMLKNGVRPTGFTLSSIVSSICGIKVDQGTQLHTWVVKIGFEMDLVVSSSLVHMYSTLGLIDDAIKLFACMAQPDLVSWNTMIMGFTLNGRLIEAIDTFKELHRRGPRPDQISLTGVLQACCYGGFIDEGTAIFLNMEECYGVRPCSEHYTCLVDLLCQDGKLYDVMEVIELMPYAPNSMIWELFLRACVIHGDVILAEKVAETLMKLDPQSSLPYAVLRRIYELRGQWEDAIRVRESRQRIVMKDLCESSIVIKNYIYSFIAEHLQQHGGRDIYSILTLLTWEEDETILLEVD